MVEIRETKLYAKWFDSLRDRNAQARIEIRIQRLALGNPGDVKSVGGGISELRINYGPGYRIYFTQRGEELILLINGGDKDSQHGDIAIAKELLEEL
jgi:putative addiction module killer protein